MSFKRWATEDDVFTFGRTRELEYVQEDHAGKRTINLLALVVNAIHDYLEDPRASKQAESAIESALREGESGIWETAGNWLLKFDDENPDSRNVWRRLARDPSSKVRFRVASFLDEVPLQLGEEIIELLRTDRSKRVREHAEAKWDFRLHPERYGA